MIFGDTTVTWNANDTSGNNADSVSQIITITDNTDPILTIPADFEITVLPENLPITLTSVDYGNCTGHRYFPRLNME